MNSSARFDHRIVHGFVGLVGRVWLVLAVACMLAGAANAATFYVNNQNPASTDGGAGTLAQPYRTISAAVTQHGGPGNAIEVLPGTYLEQVSVSASGVSGSPFVIRASEPGVVIEGAESFATAAQWVLLSGNVWLAAGVTWTPLQVLADGQRLLPSILAPDVLPAGSFTYVPGTGLYVNVAGGNPGGHGTLVGRYAYGFSVPGRSWVTIAGFEIRHSDTKGIFASGVTTNCEFRENTISRARLSGIHMSGGSAYTVASNTVFDNGDHGIYLTGGVTASTIRDNDSYRNSRINARAANGYHVFGSPGNRLERNRAHENDDSGFQMNAGSNDNVSIENRSWNNGDHGFDHLNSTGVTHVHDVSYGNFKDGFSFEGASQNGMIYNCISVNNGITTNSSDLFIDPTAAGSAGSFASDYNLFWNSNLTPPVKIGLVQYATIAAYTAATGKDAHSVQADPRFVNGPGGDFHLLATSPAVDAATSAAPNWPALDADGHERFDVPTVPNQGAGSVPFADIGSFEFIELGTSNQPPVAALVVEPASGNAPLSVTANAAGSQDPDGRIDSYTFDFGDGTGAGPQAEASAPHIYSTGTWIAKVTVQDDGGLTSSATARVVVSGTSLDRAPVVSSPNNVRVRPGSHVAFTVTAKDPDGDPIHSLTADLTRLPRNSGAQFVVDPTNTSGIFTWVVGKGVHGDFEVKFTASNALLGTSKTKIQVNKKKKDKDRDHDDDEDDAGDNDLIAANQVETNVALPHVLSLSNGWPNPAMDDVAFALELPRASMVQWAIFDVQGRTVWSEQLSLAAGHASLRWSATTARGERVAKGIYLVRVRVDGTEFTRRIVRL